MKYRLSAVALKASWKRKSMTYYWRHMCYWDTSKYQMDRLK